MNLEPQLDVAQVKKGSRRLLSRIVWASVLLALATVGLFYYISTRPQYAFLSGLELITEADPPTVEGMTPSQEKFHIEVFSFKGEYDGWKSKITRELNLAKPEFEETKSLKKLRTGTWMFGEHRNSFIPAAEHVVLLMEGRWKEGGQIDDPKSLIEEQGWLTIATLNAQPPDFWTRSKAWFKGLTGK